MKKIFGLLIGIMFAVNIMAENGVVILHQDSIMDKLMTKTDVPTDKKSAITAVGYRVQIYSNNNARKAKSEAFALEEKVAEKFPDIKCYVTYSAPFWKVRLGDFSNYSEAVVFSQKVKNELPELASEIIVTKDNNTKPLYLENTDSPQ